MRVCALPTSSTTIRLSWLWLILCSLPLAIGVRHTDSLLAQQGILPRCLAPFLLPLPGGLCLRLGGVARLRLALRHGLVLGPGITLRRGRVYGTNRLRCRIGGCRGRWLSGV